MIFHENRLLADYFHDISHLIFLKIGKSVLNLSSSAVVIGAFRANFTINLICCFANEPLPV